MGEDGYLLFRGLLERDEVLEARREVTRRLAEYGFLTPGTDPLDAIAPPREAVGAADAGSETGRSNFMPDLLAEKNAALMRVLYSGPLMEFFESFFGEPARHYDFTWFRSIFPGAHGTPPHSDVVYMGRGERERLYTAWTPIGDIDFDQGGLVILEGSNRSDALRDGYWKRDVDAYCTNREDRRDEWQSGLRGNLSQDAARVRNGLGGRWVTGEFRAGDVLIFSTYTVHCSIDNHSDRIRLSSDSRYQPASKPADERWVGPNPAGHGPAGKRGLIC